MHPRDQNSYSRETNLNSGYAKNNEPPINGGKNLLMNYFDDSNSQTSIGSNKHKFRLNKE